MLSTLTYIVIISTPASPQESKHSFPFCTRYHFAKGFIQIMAYSAGYADGTHIHVLMRSSSTEMSLLKPCFLSSVCHMKTKGFFHMKQQRIVHAFPILKVLISFITIKSNWQSLCKGAAKN